MNPILAGIVAFLTSFGLPILVGASRKSYGQEWYRRLKKPVHAASDITTNVVFLIFYLVETFAFYYLLTIDEPAAMVLYSGWFLATAVLSGIWSRLFFQYRRCDWSIAALMIEIPLLWGLIIAMFQYDNPAWFLLLPRAVWCIYAVTVNIGLYRLNIEFWKSVK